MKISLKSVYIGKYFLQFYLNIIFLHSRPKLKLQKRQIITMHFKDFMSIYKTLMIIAMISNAFGTYLVQISDINYAILYRHILVFYMQTLKEQLFYILSSE